MSDAAAPRVRPTFRRWKDGLDQGCGDRLAALRRIADPGVDTMPVEIKWPDTKPLMEFRLLGTVAVRRDGQAIPIASMPRSVLAALLLNANRAVSVEWLTEVLWDDRPP